MFRKCYIRLVLNNSNATGAQLIAPSSLFSKICHAVAGIETNFITSVNDQQNYLYSSLRIPEVNDRTQYCSQIGLNATFSPNITLAQNVPQTVNVDLQLTITETYICVDKIKPDFTVRVYAPGYAVTSNLNASNADITIVSATLVCEFLNVETNEYYDILSTSVPLYFSTWYPRLETFQYDATNGALTQFVINTSKSIATCGTYFLWLQTSTVLNTAGSRNTFANILQQAYFSDSNGTKLTSGVNVTFSIGELRQRACEALGSFFGDATPANIYVIANTCPDVKGVITKNQRNGLWYWPADQQLFLNIQTSSSAATYTVYLLSIAYSDLVVEGGTIREIPV